MVAQFVRMGHPGWYASVIQPGSFAAGDRIDFDSRPAIASALRTSGATVFPKTPMKRQKSASSS